MKAADRDKKINQLKSNVTTAKEEIADIKEKQITPLSDQIAAWKTEIRELKNTAVEADEPAAEKSE